MLATLRVVNLGVIEDVTLELSPGMTVLTGETGAGKTLLVGALSLLLGDRADPTMVRSGTDEAVVEGVFRHESSASPGGDGSIDAGNAGGEEILTRVVSASGTSKAWIDGRRVPLAGLARRGRRAPRTYFEPSRPAARSCRMIASTAVAINAAPANQIASTNS